MEPKVSAAHRGAFGAAAVCIGVLSSAPASAQSADLPFRTMESLTALGDARSQLLVVPSEKEPWQRTALLMASSGNASGGLTQQSTPFELAARRGAQQWSIAGSGLQRISGESGSTTGLSDVLLAYDRMVPLGERNLGVARLGLVIPSGSKVSSKSAQFLAAGLARWELSNGVTAVPLGLVVYDTRTPPGDLSRWVQEVRLKLEGQTGPMLISAGVRAAHRKGADNVSTVQVGLQYALSADARVIAEARRAVSGGFRANTIDLGFLWGF